MSEVPAGWATTTVGAVTLDVSTVDPRAYPDVPFTYVDISSIDNATQTIAEPKAILGQNAPSRARQSLRAGDTVFSTVRTYLRNIGYVAPSLDGAVASTGFSVLRPAEGIHPRYLYYFTLSNHFVDGLSSQMRGTSYPAVVNSQVLDMAIPVPPSREQERLVTTIEEQFSQLDAGLTALRRVWGNLRRMRAAVLETLLTDEKGMAWPTLAMRDVLQRGRYGTSTKCSYDGQGMVVLRIPNVVAGRIDLRDTKRAIDTSLDLTGSLVDEGDVLIVRTNGSRSLIGRAAVVTAQPEPFAFASYLIQLRLDQTRVDPHYLVGALSAPRLRQQIESLAATTAGQYNVSLDKLRSLAIPVPPIEDQGRMVADADERLAIITELETTVDRACRRQKQARSSILAAAFSGKLVRHNPGDEPAAILLDRIAAHRMSSGGYKTRTRTPRTTRTKVPA